MVQRTLLGRRLYLRFLIVVVLGALLTYQSLRQQSATSADPQYDDVAAQAERGPVDEQNQSENSQVALAISPPSSEPPSPEPASAVSKDQASLHVVISHFEEDPFYIRTWLDDLRSIPFVKILGLHVTIYTKGSLDLESIKGGTGADEVVQLPNIGREGSTHLQHILKQWDNLPPFTLFTQAYLKKVQQEGTGPQAGHFVDWITARLTEKFDNSTGFMSLDRKHDICYCGHCTDGNKDFYPLWPQLYTLITGKVCGIDQPTILSFNGHFIVSRNRILGRPRHVYEYLQELVDAPKEHWVHAEEEPRWFKKKIGASVPSNPKFGHTLERLWHTLFACDNSDVVEDCDIEGLKSEDKGGCMCKDV